MELLFGVQLGGGTDIHSELTYLREFSGVPNKTKDTARQVVRKVVVELLRKLAQPTQ